MGGLLASQPELNEWSTHRSDAYPVVKSRRLKRRGEILICKNVGQAAGAERRVGMRRGSGGAEAVGHPRAGFPGEPGRWEPLGSPPCDGGPGILPANIAQHLHRLGRFPEIS